MNGGFFRSNNPEVSVISLVLHQTGTYNTQVLRPYVTNVNGFTTEALVNAVNNAGGSKITPSSLGGVAGSIVSVSTEPTNSIYIPGGWGENRLRFILAVQVNHNIADGPLIHYFQGYTDNYGASSSGLLDPTMRFFINSFLTVSKVKQVTPYGVTMVDRVVSSSNVIQSRPNFDNRQIALMRPSDIFRTIQTNHVSAFGESNGYGALHDTRLNVVGSNSYSSNRTNANPTNYVSGIMNAYSTVINAGGVNSDYGDLIGDAINLADDPSLPNNPFIRTLCNVMGSPSAISDFTLRELAEIDRDIQYKTKLISPPTREANNMPSAGQSEYWETRTRETVAMTIIFNSLSAIMMEMFITSIGINSTNMSVNGQIMSFVTHANSPGTQDYSQGIEILLRRFEIEIMNDITFGNQDTYSLEINIDLFGSSSGFISLGGNPNIYYSQASFADSLYQPVVTDNLIDKNNIVSDFESVMNVVHQNRDVFAAPQMLQTPQRRF